jgi:two-component system, OmpR family, phosphate regulon sensor histidine kinase PhoR
VRRANTLAILTLMFAGGGLVIAALAVMRGDPIASGRLWSAAKLLLMLAATGGWLGLMGLRRDCRNLTRYIESARAGMPGPQLQNSDPVLVPLAAAVGNLLVSTRSPAAEGKTEAGRAETEDLAAKVRELELRLKAATAERQHAEAALFSISDGVLVTGESDEVVLANEAAANTFEFDLARAQQGRTPVDAVLQDPRLTRLIRDMRQAAAKAPAGSAAAGRRSLEHRLETPDGTRTFKVTLAPLADAPREGATGAEADSATSLAGVIAVLRDVTREKEVAEMKNDFVSLVSHELRTPLASIKAYVEMLIDGEAVDEKTTREFYEVIQNEANRLGRLIDNILNVSRIESGLMKPDRRPVSLGEVVREAVSAIAPQAEQKGVRLVQEISPGPDRTSADRDMIHQAVVNLLNNAIKYTPEGGAITVQTGVDAASKKVTARVSDTGVGILARDLPFVFEKFYRGDAVNRVACGTGLGLSLVKHVVEALHGGRVFVESKPSEGSCFGFDLEQCGEDAVT